MTIPEKHLDSILKGKHTCPHLVLGMHDSLSKGKKTLSVRTFLQDCKSCEVIDYTGKPERRYPMQKRHPDGFFEAVISRRNDPFPYRLRVERYNGEIAQFYDPYSFEPSLSEDDLYLINEGTHYHIYNKLGSHKRVLDDIEGVSFAVWAPNAKRVSVVGDFNIWDGRYHPMRSLGQSGVRELFIPGLKKGVKYKYELIDQEDRVHLKTDPYALYYESSPNNASLIWNLDDYHWNDQAWMQERSKTAWQEKPISIYEVHFGSWRRVVEDGRRPFTYREMAHELSQYVKDMGFTHVEFLPLLEHPFTGSWGYQVTGFYAPTHRYGTPQDFMYLVDTLHQNGIGVIMDWVPAHFPKDSFALAQFDGSYLYEHEDPRKGEHKEWGTLVFNYGRHEVREFLIGSALAWLDRFHIDGLRVDAVASMLYLDYSREEGSWIPNVHGGRENIEAIDFLRTFNETVHQYHPGVITIAEESTSFPGVTKPIDQQGLGFDFKWNMGWMHDNLRYFSKDSAYRKHHHNDLTFGMLYQYTENFISVFSHDEVVHGKSSMIMKMPSWSMKEKAHDLRALYAYQWLWPGKKTLFMGGEFGQSGEWHYDQSLDWHLLQYQDHQGIQTLIKDLNALYKKYSFLAYNDNSPEGFHWGTLSDADNSTISFFRLGKDPKDILLVVGNFTPTPRSNYRIGVPQEGRWQEVINTDATCYGGTGDGNLGHKETEPVPYDEHPVSLELHLPASSISVFKYHC